jgi:hypothetical protein
VNGEFSGLGRDTKTGCDTTGLISEGGGVDSSRAGVAVHVPVQLRLSERESVCKIPIVTTRRITSRIGVLTRRDLGSDSRDMLVAMVSRE